MRLRLPAGRRTRQAGTTPTRPDTVIVFSGHETDLHAFGSGAGCALMVRGVGQLESA